MQATQPTHALTYEHSVQEPQEGSYTQLSSRRQPRATVSGAQGQTANQIHYFALALSQSDRWAIFSYVILCVSCNANKAWIIVLFWNPSPPAPCSNAVQKGSWNHVYYHTPQTCWMQQLMYFAWFRCKKLSCNLLLCTTQCNHLTVYFIQGNVDNCSS